MKKLCAVSFAVLLAFSGTIFASCIECDSCTFYPDGSSVCKDCKVVTDCPPAP